MKISFIGAKLIYSKLRIYLIKLKSFQYYRLIRQATSTLRPRSGKEYHNFDRSIISDSGKPPHHPSTPSQLRGLLPCSANYANITPVPENAESPSPGYQSGGSPQEQQAEHFIFKVRCKALIYFIEQDNEFQTDFIIKSNLNEIFFLHFLF